MWRSLISAVLLYGYGHSACDSFRPAMFDRPLQGLHREVNQAAIEGQRALGGLDGARTMSYLKGYSEHMSSTLKGE
jgi:hypothetical protein